MDFPQEIPIKQEQNDLTIENNNVFVKPNFEVNVKVEDTLQEDWCVDTGSSGNFEEYQIYGVKEAFIYYVCLICYQEFLDSYSLYHHNLTHLRVLMTQETHLYQCEHCLCYYTCKKQLETHIRKKHTRKNNIMLTSSSFRKCHICKAVLKVKNWQNHMKLAHGIDEVKCTVCNVSFKCVEYFRRHLLHTHEKVRPSWRFHSVPEQEFKCDSCPAVFKNKSSRTTHIRNCHSPAHECPLCESKLKSRSYLLTHMRRVHYDDGKVHRCDVCKKKFKSPRYVAVHKKNAHGIKPKGGVRNSI